MNPGTVVVVTLQSPNERFFGRLIDVAAAGVTLRGIDLGTFDDWIRDILAGEETGVHPTTTFFPLHRVVRMVTDEAIGEVPSLSDAFRARTGRAIFLLLESE